MSQSEEIPSPGRRFQGSRASRKSCGLADCKTLGIQQARQLELGTALLSVRVVVRSHRSRPSAQRSPAEP